MNDKIRSRVEWMERGNNMHQFGLAAQAAVGRQAIEAHKTYCCRSPLHQCHKHGCQNQQVASFYGNIVS